MAEIKHECYKHITNMNQVKNTQKDDFFFTNIA